MLSAAKHLAATRDRPFAALRVTRGDCSNCHVQFVQIEPCLRQKIVFEAFACPVYSGLTIAVDRHRALPVDAPAGLAASIAVIEHACLFIDTEQHCIGQVCRHLLCPASAEGIVVRQDACIGHQPEPLDDLGLARIVVILAQDHCSGAAAGYHRSAGVGFEHGLPACAMLQRLAQVAREATQHVDQTRLPDFAGYLRIVGRGLVDEW